MSWANYNSKSSKLNGSASLFGRTKVYSYFWSQLIPTTRWLDPAHAAMLAEPLPMVATLHAKSGSRFQFRSRLHSKPAREIHEQGPTENFQFSLRIIWQEPRTWPALSKLCIPRIAFKGLVFQIYYRNSNLDCYRFCQQYKNYSARANRQNRIPFAALFLCKAIVQE